MGFYFGIYGQTIALLGIAIERLFAISMASRYKFASSKLGFSIAATMILFTSFLVLYIRIHEDRHELQFNCGSNTQTANDASGVVNTILIVIAVLTLLIYFLAFFKARTYVSFKSTQAYRDLSTEERYQYSETKSVITLLLPLVLANVIIIGVSTIITQIIISIWVSTGQNLFLLMVELYILPYYALMLPPFLVFMMKRIESHRRVITQRMIKNQGLYEKVSGFLREILNCSFFDVIGSNDHSLASGERSSIANIDSSSYNQELQSVQKSDFSNKTLTFVYR